MRSTRPHQPPVLTRRAPRGGRWLSGLTVAVALLLHRPATLPQLGEAPEPDPPRVLPERYWANGARWMESSQHELVHFVCRGGAPYVISLETRSLARAGIPSADRWQYIEALSQATRDWSEVLGCRGLTVELDHPNPGTRVRFASLVNDRTLAVATRAGDVVVNTRRRWFAGSRDQAPGNREQAVSFYWVLAHELGHVWGLSHSDRPGALMQATLGAGTEWSGFERAAGNLIRLASAHPWWSRAHDTSRSFVRTPLSIVESLLRDDLHEAETLAAEGECRSGPDPYHASEEEGCDGDDIPATAAMTVFDPLIMAEAVELDVGPDPRLEAAPARRWPAEPSGPDPGAPLAADLGLPPGPAVEEAGGPSTSVASTSSRHPDLPA